MKNLKKLTMAVLAGAMALTATCVSAFAEEESSECVLTAWDAEGNTVEYTQEDIDAQGGEITLSNGIVIKYESGENLIKTIFSARIMNRFNSTGVPTGSNYYSIRNAAYASSFSVPLKEQRFSGQWLYQNKSTIGCIVLPDQDLKYKFTAAFLVYDGPNGKLVNGIDFTVGQFQASITLTNLPQNQYTYAYLDNDNEFTATGDIEIASY